MEKDMYFAVDCVRAFCVCDQLVLMNSADFVPILKLFLSFSTLFSEATRGCSFLWIPWSALYFVSLDAV